jgi:hypothetical protein
MKTRILFAAVAVLIVACINAAAQTKYELDGNRLKTTKAITFVDATDKLDPASDEALKFVREYLTDKKYISMMRIEVHFRAGTMNAQLLSEKRALAIANWVV